jgi:Cu2+-exporting ATPase
MKLAPEDGGGRPDGTETEVGIDEVRIGDVFVVRPPAENVPVDGRHLEEKSAVNESALTGESIPGGQGGGGRLVPPRRSTSPVPPLPREPAVGEDTTLAQIIKMVSDAAANEGADRPHRGSGVRCVRARRHRRRRADLPRLAARGAEFHLRLQPARVSTLVTAAPCALGLADARAIMVGNGKGARKRHPLQDGPPRWRGPAGSRSSRSTRTGTITKGTPEVTDLIPAAGVFGDRAAGERLRAERRASTRWAKAVVALRAGAGAGRAETERYRRCPETG